jgi:hypothetical protein
MQSFTRIRFHMQAICLRRREERFDLRQEIARERGYRISRAILSRWLGNVVGCALRQSFESNIGPPSRKRTAHNDLCLRVPGTQFCQRLKAIQARHFYIEKNEVGLEAFNSIKRSHAISRHPSQLNRRIRRKHHAQQAAHDEGIVHDKDTNGRGGHQE